MDKHTKRCLFILVFVLLFITVPYFIYSYALADSPATATGCFIINQPNLNANQDIPAACITQNGTGNGSESPVVQKVISLAKAHLTTGTYLWGSPNRNWAADKSTGPNDPPHFDCSGFVGWAWYWATGGTIVMGGQTNYDWSNEGNNPHYEKIVTRDESQMQPGDLIYFNFTSAPESGTDHVGMYIGKDTSQNNFGCTANDCFIQYYETPYPGNEVSLKSLLPYVVGVIRMKNP